MDDWTIFSSNKFYIIKKDILNKKAYESLILSNCPEKRKKEIENRWLATWTDCWTDSLFSPDDP